MPKLGGGGGGWSVMLAAIRYLVLGSFTLYGVWWTELLAATRHRLRAMRAKRTMCGWLWQHTT